jgi:transcriptional regulator GlxA family with amidase domain
MRDRSAAANFGIVVYQGVEPIDIGGTVGVISMARRVLPAIEAAVVAAASGQVALAGGLSIIAQHGFADALTFDQVIGCGGPGWPAAAEDASLRAFLRRQPVLYHLCLLAQSWLRRCARRASRDDAPPCSSAEDRAPLARLPELGRDIRPREALVVDAGVVTGGGVALAIDATLYLIGRLYGDDARNGGT